MNKFRGSKLHIPNKYLKLNYLAAENLNQDYASPVATQMKTKFIEITAKSMINIVNSPDLAMEYSLNPYQGCEHGCVYCYARPTHNYWGYSSADEFENTVLVKTNAVDVLKKELSSKNYKVKPIMLSGNTDCYQPAERKFKITRSILQLFVDWKQPVQIITKNYLMSRDLDLLSKLNESELCSVAISLTAANDKTRRIMEPRASSIQSRLKLMQILSRAGIPVHAMIAPVIPGINDAEIFSMLKLAANAGANSASYQIVRLNGDLQIIFENFLDQQFPDRKEKILNQIRACHGGKLSDSRFGMRMKGEGKIAEMINRQFKLAYSKYFPHPVKVNLRSDLFSPIRNGQMNIW